MHFEPSDRSGSLSAIVLVVIATCGSNSLLGSAVVQIKKIYALEDPALSGAIFRGNYEFRFQVEKLLSGLDLKQEMEAVRQHFPNCSVTVTLRLD